MNSHRILVTGGSRGIGRAIAHSLAKSGHRIAIQYNTNQGAAEECLETLAGSGHCLIATDLSRPDQARKLVSRVADKLEGLDGLVNNAGIHYYHPPAETDPAAWEQAWRDTLEVNLIAPMLLAHAAIPLMRSAGGGRIVNIGSRGAYRGEPGGPAYGAAKAGLHAGMQSMAQALAPEGIFITTVAPGFVATEMVSGHLQGPAGDSIRGQSPFKRVARPEEVAQVVDFLMSGNGDWLTGGVLDCNGASHLR